MKTVLCSAHNSDRIFSTESQLAILSTSPTDFIHFSDTSTSYISYIVTFKINVLAQFYIYSKIGKIVQRSHIYHNQFPLLSQISMVYLLQLMNHYFLTFYLKSFFCSRIPSWIPYYT